MAHSMSWGRPRCSSTLRARSPIARALAAPNTVIPGGASIEPSSSTVHRSGVAAPETRRSPSPSTASMTVRRRPVTGSVVKATPAASAATIGWMRTAIEPAPRSPR